MNESLVEQGKERREQILVFVKDYTEQEGEPPSLSEVAEGLGMKSRSSVHRHMTQLVDAGLLRRTKKGRYVLP